MSHKAEIFQNPGLWRDFQVHIEAPKLMAWKDPNFQLLALILMSDIQILNFLIQAKR